jgi:hypothetical protein
MRVRLARIILALAASAMGARRRSWGEAMQAELDEAIVDGTALSFATGCLVAALRELPRLPEGRIALASYALALGLIVPAAAVSLWMGLVGYPYLAFGEVGIAGFFAGRSAQIPMLVYGEGAMVPALTMIILLQAIGQLLLAWFLLDRNWERVEAISGFNAAALTTLAIVMSLLSLIDVTILLSASVLVTESLAVLTMAWWHQHLPPPQEPQVTQYCA